MTLDILIKRIRNMLVEFNDDTAEIALSILENNPNLAWSRYSLGNNIDFGIIEAFASRCYQSKLYLETLSLEDVYYLEDLCNDTKSNNMLIKLLKLYGLLSAMTEYFDALPMSLAARDVYQSYSGTIKIADEIVNTYKSDLIDDDLYKEFEKLFIEIYEAKKVDNRECSKDGLKEAIKYGDLFLFESAFCDFCVLNVNIQTLGSSEYDIIINKLDNRLDELSDDISMDVLKKIAPLIYRFKDSELELTEKEKILNKKVNERI